MNRFAPFQGSARSPEPERGFLAVRPTILSIIEQVQPGFLVGLDNDGPDSGMQGHFSNSIGIGAGFRRIPRSFNGEFAFHGFGSGDRLIGAPNQGVGIDRRGLPLENGGRVGEHRQLDLESDAAFGKQGDRFRSFEDGLIRLVRFRIGGVHGNDDPLSALEFLDLRFAQRWGESAVEKSVEEKRTPDHPGRKRKSALFPMTSRPRYFKWTPSLLS